MSSLLSKLLCAMVLLAAVAEYVSASCSYTIAGTSDTFDLSGLASSSDYIFSGTDSGTGTTYEFRLNFCQNVQGICSVGGNSAPSPAVQYDAAGQSCKAYLGFLNGATLSYKNPNDKNGGLILVYPNGYKTTYPRQAVINLNCVPGTKVGTPSFVGEAVVDNIRTYTFSLDTSLACYGSHGGGGGSTGKYGCTNTAACVLFRFFFWFIVIGGFLTYLIAGIVINKVKFQATGKDLIPNLAFWKDLPFLVKDGIMLIVDGCKACCCKNKYNQVK
eukprot:GEZU01027984.1.p1 GENE.GEZU01027984.1~~GEZU01027984.1.p1  ORF type:complete len:273 (+),score=98.12 GEZU01027984.1:71-889(+)